MLPKISVPITDAVSDTLFIPLYMRHLETLRQDGIVHDPLASQLVERIDYDFGKYTTFKKTQVGTAIRVRHFDREVKRFVRENDDPVVISVGAGLDTRFQRVYEGKGVFYELDLPEVMDFREQFLPSDKANPSLATSMFDTRWIEDVAGRHPGAQFAVVAEGVFMYFEETQLKPLMLALVEGLGQGELHFDACSGLGVKNTHRHETVKLTNARFRWAFDDDDGLTQWTPALRHVATEYYMNQERARWGMSGFILSVIPCMRTMFRMVHYEMNRC